MDEQQAVKIVTLLDMLLERLQFDVKHQPPVHLPVIADVIVQLHKFKDHTNASEQKATLEIDLLKNINNQIKGYGK